MKKVILTMICALLMVSVTAQTKQRVEADLAAAENSKSGNFKDILTGFYQLAFKTISKDERSIEFNSSLFAFIKKNDNDILKTRSRNDIRFLRNFQVNSRINLDDKFNFNGYSAGFIYAIVNERDRSFVNFNGTAYDRHDREFKKLLRQARQQVYNANSGALSAEDRVELGESLNEISNDIVNGRTSAEPLYTNVINALDTLISASAYFKAIAVAVAAPMNTAALAQSYISTLRNGYMANLEGEPLLTISTDGIANRNNKFNRVNAEMIFLAGNRFGEIDIRAKFSYADTLAVSMPRSVLNAKIGYNFKLVKGSNNKSVLELKGSGEYNNILKNVMPDEKESTFLANAELRFRLTDDLWIPFTIKYDIENANVLGFLNISYNFGS